MYKVLIFCDLGMERYINILHCLKVNRLCLLLPFENIDGKRTSVSSDSTALGLHSK